MVGQEVNLDLLPLKRVFHIEENGTEHLPPERTPEEKLRFLLQRVDFESTEEKDAKKAKSNKESASQAAQKWPWQAVVEDLQMAHQELSYILDFITHVESNDAITVVNMLKPKQLIHELCSELALRVASKLHNFKEIGKHLKHTARALEKQVDREAVFYGALMRLQQHWKVKRLRGISAGPGGNAGFTIDLSYPHIQTEMISGLSMRSAGFYFVNVEQDSTGLLMADIPGHSISKLNMNFVGPYNPRYAPKDGCPKEDSGIARPSEANVDTSNTSSDSKPREETEKGVGEAVNKGALAAHSVLRRIQMAIVEEQIFEWTVREALQSSSGLVVTAVEENSVQLSLGNSSSLVLDLLKVEDLNKLDSASPKSKEEMESQDPNYNETTSRDGNSQGHRDASQLNKASNSFQAEMSALLSLYQAFYNSAYGAPQTSTSKVGQPSLLNRGRDTLTGICQDHIVVESATPLKHFSLAMRHRVLSSKVLWEIEKLVNNVPYLFLSFHPTWNSRISVWELRVQIPRAIMQGWKMTMVQWGEAKNYSSSKFYAKVVLCDASLYIEGQDFMSIQDRPISDKFKRSKHKCELSELPGFLLYQLAGYLVKWLYEEAMVIGLKARRNLLSLYFSINSKDDIAILATLDIQDYCINWWLQSLNPKMEDGQRDSNSCKRFLGPLSLETLRGVLVDLLNSCTEEV